MTNSLKRPIVEASQVGEARRLAVWLAQRQDFGETETGRVAIVAGEMASNLVKHATGGELLARPLERAGINGLELLTLDRGPGIADLGQCLQDGYSTTGSAGNGLGAISRLSALFDIYSLPGVGTAVLARLWAKPLPSSLPFHPLEIGAVSLAKPGQEANGDDWMVTQQPGRALILVADGLGYGPLAAAASGEAARIFRENSHLDPVAMIRAIHPALVSTRGAAVAVAEVDAAQQRVHFAGVGNISGAIATNGHYHGLVSHHGIVGYEMRKVQQFSYALPAGALLVLHSDGLQTRWSLDRYPGLAQKHPSLIAGLLYRDFRRESDDITVIAARVLAGGFEEE